MAFAHYSVFPPGLTPPKETAGKIALAGWHVEQHRLIRPELPVQPALLVFDDAVALTGDGGAPALADEVLQLDADGVYLDFERPVCAPAIAFLRRLEALLPQRLILAPWVYAFYGASAQAVYTWHPTEGAFFKQLSAHQAQTRRPLWLELVPVSEQVLLNHGSPRCVPVPFAQIRSILQEASPAIYFSPALQCQYFTLRQGEDLALYLFDTHHTFTEKQALTRSLRLAGTLTLWPETELLKSDETANGQASPHTS